MSEGYWDFNTLVQNVIARRRQNPRFNLPTNFDEVATEVDTQNAERVSRIPNAGLFIIDDGGGGGVASVFPIPQAVRLGAVGKVRNVATGVKLLTEWLGSGATPVERSVAVPRAEICSTCPRNSKGDWSKFFVESAAEAIRKQVGIKHEMTLSTPFDSELGTCEACLCFMPLKIWVPEEYIKAHTSEKTKQNLAPQCWQLPFLNKEA